MKFSPILWIFMILSFMSFFLTSCTQSPPSILASHVTSLWSDDETGLVPTHLFFEIEIANPPNFEDLREISVRNPARQLSWRVDGGDLQSTQSRGRTRIVLPPLGFEPIGFYPVRPIPFGTYELEVSNNDGQFDRITFFFPRSLILEISELYTPQGESQRAEPEFERFQTEFGNLGMRVLNDFFWVYRRF